MAEIVISVPDGARCSGCNFIEETDMYPVCVAHRMELIQESFSVIRKCPACISAVKQRAKEVKHG